MAKSLRTILVTLLFVSAPVMAESECDTAYNTYTLKCSEAEAQCSSLTHCKEIKDKCVDNQMDLRDQQTCNQLQACVSKYYSDRMANGIPVILGNQCRYNWNQPTVVRDQSNSSCKFSGYPWNPVANNCPGASIFYKGDTYNDSLYRCSASQEKYFKLHGECETAKAFLKQRCDINIREAHSGVCNAVTFPTTIELNTGVGPTVGERNSYISGFSTDLSVINSVGLSTKPSTFLDVSVDVNATSDASASNPR